jgi:cobalt/nickel transport system ATP-binding protein
VEVAVMTTPFTIETRGVSFSYQEGSLALDSVDFQVRPGEFVAMLASNGSGKTTLIKVLMGLLKAQEGTVLIEGKDLRELPARELYQKVGLVFQNPDDQLFAATVEEDVSFGPRNLGLPEQEVQNRVEKSLEAVAACELRHRAVHHLSFGEKKRVCLAGVLAMGPSTLILDEPTQGLDPKGESTMLHLLHRLNRERGVTVVLATHSVDMLPLFVDRIYVLNRGRVLREGPAEEIFRDHDMIKKAGLRLPYISSLLYELKRYDGVPINGLPLTIGEARERLLEIIPEELIQNQLKGEKR